MWHALKLWAQNPLSFSRHHIPCRSGVRLPVQSSPKYLPMVYPWTLNWLFSKAVWCCDSWVKPIFGKCHWYLSPVPWCPWALWGLKESDLTYHWAITEPRSFCGLKMTANSFLPSLWEVWSNFYPLESGLVFVTYLISRRQRKWYSGTSKLRWKETLWSFGHLFLEPGHCVVRQPKLFQWRGPWGLESWPLVDSPRLAPRWQHLLRREFCHPYQAIPAVAT